VELKEGRNGHAGLGFANERQEEPGNSKTSDSSISGLQSGPVLAEEALSNFEVELGLKSPETTPVTSATKDLGPAQEKSVEKQTN